MISCNLFGRTGNQLFQIAASLGYSYDYNVPFFLPNNTLNDDVWPNYFKGMFVSMVPQNELYVTYREKSHSFRQIPYHENIILHGYFQSWKYFYSHRDKILEAFGFSNLDTNEDTVGVHIRRGDYLTYPNHHPVVPLDYIRLGAERIRGDYEFLVFTDDVDWAKKNITSHLFSGREFEIIDQGDPVLDMRYYSMCSKHIISNSTWSWWGAYLSNSYEKQVICPSEQNWFGPANGHLDVSDLLMPDWVRIKY